MANEFIARKGLIALDNSVVSGSFSITGNAKIGDQVSDVHTVTGSFLVSGSITGSLFGTASWAINALTASTVINQNYAVFTQSVPSTTWVFNHNLSQRAPIVSVYDSAYNMMLPDAIVGTSENQSTILFSSPRTGYASATVGSIIANNSFATYLAYAIVL